MVTLAKTEQDWGRANYLELSEGPLPPQAIGTLLTQVLARYSLANSEAKSDSVSRTAAKVAVAAVADR